MKDSKSKQREPELRFPNFSGEWSNIKLEELIDERIEYPKENLPLYSLTIEDGVTPKTSRYERSFLVKSSTQAYKVMHKDDFAFNPMNLRFGAIARHDEDKKITVSKYYNIFYAKSNVSPEFLEFYLKRRPMINFYDRMSEGTLEEKKRVHYLDFIHFVKPFPEHDEQIKIADFFTHVNEWIDVLKKEKLWLVQYKKGLMQKIFSQELRFKDESGKSYPNWTNAKIEDVFTARKGQGLSKDEVSNSGKNKCILYGELYTTYPEVIQTVISRTDSQSGIKSKVGDILIPCSTTTNRFDLANVTALNEANVLLGGDISILRFNKSGNSIFFAYYLSHFKKSDIAKYGQGSTIIHLYFNHFKKVKISFPSSIEEQNKIAESIGAIEALIKAKDEQVKNAELWKKGLLQKMFV